MEKFGLFDLLNNLLNSNYTKTILNNQNTNENKQTNVTQQKNNTAKPNTKYSYLALQSLIENHNRISKQIDLDNNKNKPKND